MKKILVMIFALMSVGMTAAVSLVVKPLSGEECMTALGLIGKITFAGDSMYVYDNDGEAVYGELVKNIQHIRFADEETSSPTDVENTQEWGGVSLKVYPNPTLDVLHVENASGEMVRLYNTNGQLMQMARVENGKVEMDMSGCATGNYILLCGTEAFRVVKQ